MKPPESLFLKCNCGCGVLEINVDEFIGEEQEFYFASWVSPHNGTKPMSKKERIRWCEHVMKTGKPWADHTIVTNKDAARIVEFLTKHIKTNGKSSKV